MRKWKIDDSAELYNINGWGLSYFSINDKGHVQVSPRAGYASVDLKEVMDELQVRDVTAPVLLRFPDILANRIERIPTASSRQPLNMTIRVRISSSTPSRSIRCAPWWKSS